MADNSEVTPLKVALGIVLLACCGVLGCVVYVLRVRLPPPTGPYPVGTTILNLTDSARTGAGRPRELVVQLWYPAAASASTSSGGRARYARLQELSAAHAYLSLVRTDSLVDAPISQTDAAFPVLLFGHRWAGERTQNTALAQELASHGYVVAGIDHPGNSSRVLLGDGRVVEGSEDMAGPEPDSAAARIAWWDRTLEVWARDDEFVLNTLAARTANAADPLHGRLDTQRVGAFGHSFGGAAALRLLGRDPRVRGAVNLDGYTFGALSDRTSAERVLMVYEQAVADDVARRRGESSPGSMEDQLGQADDAGVEANLARFGGERVYVAGTQHRDFTDEPLLPLARPWRTGPIAPRRADALTRQIVLGFFNQVLRGGPEVEFKGMPEVRVVGSGSR